MKLRGFINKETVIMTNAALVDHYETYSIGDGQWSIEAKETPAQGVWSPCLKEWVGSNGTRYDEEPDDLWARVAEWEKEVIDKYKVLVAPDGTRGKYSFFMKEARKGHLHGLICIL